LTRRVQGVPFFVIAPQISDASSASAGLTFVRRSCPLEFAERGVAEFVADAFAAGRTLDCGRGAAGFVNAGGGSAAFKYEPIPTRPIAAIAAAKINGSQSSIRWSVWHTSQNLRLFVNAQSTRSIFSPQLQQ